MRSVSILIVVVAWGAIALGGLTSLCGGSVPVTLLGYAAGVAWMVGAALIMNGKQRTRDREPDVFGCVEEGLGIHSTPVVGREA